ncbi:ABC-type glycerol-3-phosphate transport system substrate-binding protein [Anaerotaenia torta]|uniref:hypothetical protein n=1 Tax=Anaerotaenia torta TaxID=433293 RepID=UPI003D19FF4D
MRNIKRYALFALLACFFFTLPACASPAELTGPDRSVLPDSLQGLSFDEHLDISVGYWNIDAMVKAAQPDDVTQYMEELFNITLHPVSVTWSNYKERYQILSATGSLPDVFATVTISSSNTDDSASYTDMIESGSIRALPEDLSSYPLLNGLLKAVPYTRYSDGAFYAIPRVSFTTPILTSTDAALLVRRDWMNQLGLEDPENFEEFLALTAAFAKEDPDGNGIDDTIGYNVNTRAALGKWVILGIAPKCNIFSWVEENGRFVPTWTTEDFKTVIASYRRLYDAGGLDPEFYTKSPVTVMEDFAAGRLGALEYKSSPSAFREVKEQWDVLNDKPFEECVDVLPVFPAPDGIRYSNSSGVFWSESYISSAADDAKLERILALFEFLLSEQGRRLCLYGIEGVDYTRTEDGNYKYLLNIDEKASDFLERKYPSLTLFANIATWGGGWEDFEDTEMNYQRYGEACVKLARKSVLWYQENTTQIIRPHAFLLYPKEPSDYFNSSQVLGAFIECIIGNGDPIRMWESTLNTMYEQGLEEYIDRQNENYQNRNKP